MFGYRIFERLSIVRGLGMMLSSPACLGAMINGELNHYMRTIAICVAIPHPGAMAEIGAGLRGRSGFLPANFRCEARNLDRKNRAEPQESGGKMPPHD